MAVGPETENPGRAKAMSKLTVQGVISILTIVGILSLAGALFFAQVPDESREYFIIILTLLVAKVSTVFDYHFGSSQGSATKTDIIQNLTSITPMK
jgi:predicted MFS family arabinose efflux permease